MNQNKKLMSGLQVLLSLGALRGLYYLKAIKRKIQLNQEILALDIELSNEVHIPEDLCIQELPISFHYYDSMILKLKNSFSFER